MLRVIAVSWLVLALLGQAGLAQAAERQLKDGFELGKFFTSCSMLALEIEAIQTLASEISLATGTGQIPAPQIPDQLPGQQLVHAYAIWRLHGFIIPLCEGGLKVGALDPAVLGSLAGMAELVLTDIYVAASQFAANEEISGLEQFASQAQAQEFVTRLLTLAKGAKLKAQVPAGQEAAPGG